jgi:hypothetical protein
MKNYPGRGDPDINTKMTFKNLMADVAKGAPVCTSEPAVYGDLSWRKRIQVAPGKTFYYAYLENGHITKDKAGRGTFYGVYWTGQPETELTLTTELTDARLVDGKLHDFDDKNCGQTFEDGDFDGTIKSGRAGNDFSCVGEVTVPVGTKPGVYNMVWFWRFYNEDGGNSDIMTTGGHFGGAAYSSCFQMEVTGAAEMESLLAESPTDSPSPSPSPVATTATPTATPSSTPTPAPNATSPSTPTPTQAPVAPEPSATSAPTPVSTLSSSEPPTTLGLQAQQQQPTGSNNAQHKHHGGRKHHKHGHGHEYGSDTDTKPGCHAGI